VSEPPRPFLTLSGSSYPYSAVSFRGRPNIGMAVAVPKLDCPFVTQLEALGVTIFPRTGSRVVEPPLESYCDRLPYTLTSTLLARRGAIMNGTYSRILTLGTMLASALLLSTGPSWAGTPVPAPLVGVTGPVGIAVAGIAYGGYLLVKRYRNRR
jgi:hypothetical protein